MGFFLGVGGGGLEISLLQREGVGQYLGVGNSGWQCCWVGWARLCCRWSLCCCWHLPIGKQRNSSGLGRLVGTYEPEGWYGSQVLCAGSAAKSKTLEQIQHQQKMKARNMKIIQSRAKTRPARVMTRQLAEK